MFTLAHRVVCGPPGAGVSGPLRLEPEQQHIVECLHGGVLVMAPVGTGKTMVLARRLAHAIASGFEAGRILCLTFTNRAALQIQASVAATLAGARGRPTLKTFHALCAEILHREARRAGLPADFTIADEDDSVELLKAVGNLSRQEAYRLLGRLEEWKSSLSEGEVAWPPPLSGLGGTAFDDGTRPIVERYQRLLMQRHTLDFGDLVLAVRALFVDRPEVRGRWASRFDLVQVDEVQDTHASEYEVVRTLAGASGNLALFGDLDQTIYEWRGADPHRVLARFEAEFAPVRRFDLTRNHRATRLLLAAAASLARGFARRSSRELAPADGSPEGEPILLHAARDVQAEAGWIGERILELERTQPDFRSSSIGVLAGTNRRRQAVAEGLRELGIPFHPQEDFGLNRRQEVKDALALVRLVVNPNDSGATARVARRIIHGVGTETLRRIGLAGEPLGLRLTDLLRVETFAYGEPFARLIRDYRDGRLMVLDVETTGLSEASDEVVEVAAQRLQKGRVDKMLHRYLRNSTPVADSADLHHLSDDFVAANGHAPEEVYAELFSFCGDDLLVVGHNVSFDLRMIAAHARRLGMAAPEWESADTYLLAQRFLEAERLSLEALADRLSLTHRPAHRAARDVEATAELLGHLVERVAVRTWERRALVAGEGAAFRPLAEKLAEWRRLSASLRPHELLERMLEESGLVARYEAEPQRVEHLRELVERWERHDTRHLGHLEPPAALREMAGLAALARSVDQVDGAEERVLVLTIHQAKGLEFDHVFVAGVSDDDLPRWYAVREERLEEERRLFYVALTRARRRVLLSYARESEHGHPRRESRLLGHLDPDLVVSV